MKSNLGIPFVVRDPFTVRFKVIVVFFSFNSYMMFVFVSNRMDKQVDGATHVLLLSWAACRMEVCLFTRSAEIY